MQRIVFGMSDTETKKFTLEWYTVCRNIRKAKKVPFFKIEKVHKVLIIRISGR